MNTKSQGNIGVAAAIAYFTANNIQVSIPLGDNSRYDLIVEINGKLKKVQCKTSRYQIGKKYKVGLKTTGGNKSRSSKKLISKGEADLLFVYTFDGGHWLFPPKQFINKVSLTLGKSKEIYRVK